MSKGSVRRPQQVSREEYERRWGETFDHGALHRLAAEFPRMVREAEDALIARVGPPSFPFDR